MDDEGVSRTAPATPGVLKTLNVWIMICCGIADVSCIFTEIYHCFSEPLCVTEDVTTVVQPIISHQLDKSLCVNAMLQSLSHFVLSQQLDKKLDASHDYSLCL